MTKRDLLDKLPGEFLLHEEYAPSGAGRGATICDLSGEVLFALHGGEGRTFRALWRDKSVVKIKAISDGRGASPVVVSFMKA